MFSGKCDKDIFAASRTWSVMSMCHDFRFFSVTVAEASFVWAMGCLHRLGDTIDLSTPKSSFKQHARKSLWCPP